MESIGVRELRQHASRWLERVQAGESFEITDRGRPVATLSPVSGTEWDRLIATGAAQPARGRLVEIEPLGAEGGSSLSELLAVDRDDHR